MFLGADPFYLRRVTDMLEFHILTGRKKERKGSRYRFALCVLLLVILLAGCSKTVTEGEVISKEFTPAHTQTALIPVIHTNGKTPYTTFVPFIYYYNDKWEVTIQQYDDEQQEMLFATYRVTEEVYNAVTIGSEFVYSSDMEPKEPEYERERQ